MPIQTQVSLALLLTDMHSIHTYIIKRKRTQSH